ncbi:MAG TPA: hypothetical protein VII91_01350 [Bauldia sp.]
MRHAIRNIPETAPDAATGVFIVGAVLCAAVIVALFAFNGGPDLLGGRFDNGLTAFQSP